jgi:hypothetical protein
MAELLHALAHGWDAYWFAPASGATLALARTAILGYALWKLRDPAYDFAAWQRARTQLAAHWQPPWLLQIARVPMLSARTDAILRRVLVVSLACGAIGLASQLACATALVAALYLLGMRHGLRVHHTTLAIKLWLLAFAFTPATDVWSMDALISRQLGGTIAATPEAYGWCLQLCRTVVAITIFATGVAKLRNMSRDAGFCHRGNLADLLRLHDYPLFFVKPLISISGLVRRYAWLERGFAVGVVGAELGFPITLVWPAAGWLFVPAILGMIAGFRVFIGARFDLLAVGVLVFFLPWSRLIHG